MAARQAKKGALARITGGLQVPELSANNPLVPVFTIVPVKTRIQSGEGLR
jgi:hypothetical protein